MAKQSLKEPTYKVDKACILLYVRPKYDSVIAKEKFKDKELTLSGWKKLFKEHNLNFKI